MTGEYQLKLEHAEALVARSRTPEERKAFEEIANIWRRLMGETSRVSGTATPV
jgi:hypothetical protein